MKILLLLQLQPQELACASCMEVTLTLCTATLSLFIDLLQEFTVLAYILILKKYIEMRHKTPQQYTFSKVP